MAIMLATLLDLCPRVSKVAVHHVYSSFDCVVASMIWSLGLLVPSFNLSTT